MDYPNQKELLRLQSLASSKKGVAAFIGAECSAALKIPLWTELLAALNTEFKYYATEQELKVLKSVSEI